MRLRWLGGLLNRCLRLGGVKYHAGVVFLDTYTYLLAMMVGSVMKVDLIFFRSRISQQNRDHQSGID